MEAKPTITSATIDRVIGLLDAIDGKLGLISDYVLENRAPVEERIEAKAIDKIEQPAIDVINSKEVPLVDQKGESVDYTNLTPLTPDTIERLNFDTVKAEAQLLCNIEKETTKAGFHKAKAIISSFAVGKLQDLKPEFYEDIVNQFRTEVKNWK